MAKKPDAISATVNMKVTATKSAKPTGSSDDNSANFSFGWENTAFDPLMYVAREIVDQVWPDTDTPDIINGVWDSTPIMSAVMAALKRGFELRDKDLAAEEAAAKDREDAA